MPSKVLAIAHPHTTDIALGQRHLSDSGHVSLARCGQGDEVVGRRDIEGSGGWRRSCKCATGERKGRSDACVAHGD